MGWAIGLGESMYPPPTLRVWRWHYSSPKPPHLGSVDNRYRQAQVAEASL